MTTPTLLPGMRIVIRLPIDRLVSAEILGSRYYTSRNNGRTSFVYDYVYEDGRTSFATVEEIARENPTLFAPLAAPAAKPAPQPLNAGGAISYAYDELRRHNNPDHAPAIQTLKMILEQSGTQCFDPHAETLCDLIDIIVFG